MKTINTGPVAFLSSVSMAALIAVGVAQPARADTVWTGAVDQDWTNPDNWSTGAVPDGADDVVINGAGGTPFLTDAGGGAAQSLTVGDATGSAGLEIIEQGWLEISGDMIVSDPEGENHGEVRVSGPDASLTIDGSLTITDVNVYTSFMEIVDGAVVAVKGTTTVGKDAYLVLKGENGGNLVGEGALVLEGGLSIHPTSGLMVLDKDLIGSGEIWLHTGSGTVILQGYNTAFDGLIRMVEGEVETGSDHALGGSRGHAVLEMTGGTLRLNHQSGVSELGGTGGTVEMNDVYLFVHQDSDSVYSGALAGTGGLYKFGAGTLTLAGANSHAGHTIVEEGRLEVAGGSAIADSASVIVEQPGTFVVADSETLDGLGLYGGTVEIAAGQTLAAGQVLMSGGQLDGGTVEATGLEIQAGTVGSVLAGTGHVLKSGAGDATLSAQNTHTGGTTIEAGKLTVTGATGDVVVNGGVLGGNGTVGTIVAGRWRHGRARRRDRDADLAGQRDLRRRLGPGGRDLGHRPERPSDAVRHGDDRGRRGERHRARGLSGRRALSDPPRGRGRHGRLRRGQRRYHLVVPGHRAGLWRA